MNFYEVLRAMAEYVFLEVLDRPVYHIFIVAVMAILAYVLESIIVGIPVLIWEAITKKKIPFDTKEKVAFRITIVFTVILVLSFIYQAAT